MISAPRIAIPAGVNVISPLFWLHVRPICDGEYSTEDASVNRILLMAGKPDFYHLLEMLIRLRSIIEEKLDKILFYYILVLSEAQKKRARSQALIRIRITRESEMNYLYDHKIEARRHEDLLEDADAARLREQLPRQEPRFGRMRQRLLTNLGESLVVWGDRLRTRYAATNAPVNQTEPCAPGHCRLAEPLRMVVPVKAR